MHHQAYTASAAAAAAHHQYKVPRLYFKIPRVLPYKEQREKFETDDYFKKLARESEVRKCPHYLPPHFHGQNLPILNLTYIYLRTYMGVFCHAVSRRRHFAHMNMTYR